jgi:hypothetical protein
MGLLNKGEALVHRGVELMATMGILSKQMACEQEEARGGVDKGGIVRI